MARGWESKAVDDQIADADARTSAPGRPALTPAERERVQRRETLQLNRARTLQTLQAACNRRHRGLLEETIAALDRELAALDEERS